MAKSFSIGVDYGTNSCRGLLVDTSNGKELASHVYEYPSGTNGILLDRKDPNLARQNPADYIEGFYRCVKSVVAEGKKKQGFASEHVVGIGVDTTGSTPIPVDKDGTPLAMQKRFKNNLAAQAWLWKDHTAHQEAREITELAEKSKAPYLKKCGGVYSSEWFWSKILHCERTAPAVFKAAHSWVEACDFIPAYVTGNLNPETMPRSICAAGHKAMFNTAWGGLPSKNFLKKLSPKLASLRDRLYNVAMPSNEVAGHITPESAKKVGLPAGIPVAVGAFDAHHGAVGSGIKPGTLVKILGTSTCDMMVAPMDGAVRDIPGVCGVVPGSIVPGMLGIEAGQSAVGDIFNWFVKSLCPSDYTTGDPQVLLSKAAAKLTPAESGLLALDWNNGNRTILVDPLLTGLLVGQTLHTTAPEVYRALVEATAFGALVIINRIEENGVKVKEVVTGGGIAEKNAFIMQVYADILNRPIRLSRSAQTCALGAAIFGAVAGGTYKTTETAQKKMTSLRKTVYQPKSANVNVYKKLFSLYSDLHDAFGLPKGRDKLDHVMKELIELRNAARKG